ncbi:TPA: hypothetical protein QCW42_004002 [Bacillus cereus]|nr:hypothetical protein [Bacillus cereus]
MRLKLNDKREYIAKKGDVIVYGMYNYLIVQEGDGDYTLLNLNVGNVMTNIKAQTIPSLMKEAQNILGNLGFAELIPEEEIEMRRVKA